MITIVNLLKVGTLVKNPNVGNEATNSPGGVRPSGEAKEEDFVPFDVVRLQPEIGFAYILIEAPTSSSCVNEMRMA